MFRVSLLLLLWNFGVANSFFMTIDRRNEVQVCVTKECENTAQIILKGMNQSADPCDNFHNYVCGNWPLEYPIPPSKKQWNMDKIVEKQVDIDLRNILEEDINSSDDMALKLEKEWYGACMNEERLQEKGFETVAWFVENIGGWPMTRDYFEWNEEEFPWQKVSQYFTGLFGEYSLFSLSLVPNPTNSSVYILALSQASESLFQTLLPIENDDEDDNIIEERKLLKKVAKAYAKSRGTTEENVNKEAEKVIKFIKMLKKNKATEEETNQTPMTIDILQTFYDENNPGDSSGKIDWLQMIRATLMDSGIQINGDERILILDRTYIQNLAQLLKTTPQRTIVNYVHWTFVKDSLKYLDKEKREWYSDMMNRLDGVKEDKERWEYCLYHMPLPHGTSAAYVKRHFSQSLKDIAIKITAEVRKEMELQILSSSWMNEETKLSSIEKLAAMKTHIGYPESYKNESYMNHVYDGLKLGPDYFNNVLNYFKYGTEKAWKSFREPINTNEFAMLPTTVNAVYYVPENALTLPAAELKIPLFSVKLPVAVNYGSVSFIIAHEISHGFDNNGRKYDKNGNRLTWWSQAMIELYEERAKCFIDQFNNYKVNGKKTASENIADTTGLITAFEVFKNKMEKENLKDERLPGLENLNEKQLFFVSFAASFCSNITPQYAEILKKFDRHTSAIHRINGAVSNMKDFSKAFRCPKNSPMNPEHKCNILK